MTSIKLTLLPLLACTLLACKEKEFKPAAFTERPRILTDEERQQIDESLSQQKIGSMIEARVSWLTKEGFKSGALDKTPKFYLLYTSASW